MIARPLSKVRSVNSNASAFFANSDTVTEPVGDQGTAAGVTIIEVGLKGNGIVPRYLELWPYALGNAGDTFSLRVVAWQRTLPQLASGQFQWTAEEMCEIACTLGTSTGVAGGNVLNTELYVTTITIVNEETITADVTRQGTVLVFSPGNNQKAHIRIELEGIEKLQIDLKQTLNTPLMNALFRFYDILAE